ncbi:MAG: ABC transporter substrate-binding protein [Candidatus Bathyarchaeota archaeon]|nr:ABC transporter substrate-binding protein [Candidatus Bathyarchaeota archaeon]MDH5746640.1 ABC transporter substrate-binding protein [Candidatus Bathyarchaeota archaeon]
MDSKIEMAIVVLLIIAIITPSAITAYMIGTLNESLGTLDEKLGTLDEKLSDMETLLNTIISGLNVSVPLAVMGSASPTSGAVILTVSLKAVPIGGTSPYSFEWDFGDGTATSSERTPTHDYTSAGTYTATITVTDGAEATASDTITVTVLSAVTKLLRVGFAWPTFIDPAVGSDYSSSTAFTNLYDPLVFPTTTGEVKPWIVESWTTSQNGLNWTFTLRDDVTFHSGRQLKADDVLFSMERLITIGQGYAYLFSPYVDVNASKAIDDYTVQFTLKKTFGPFLTTLERLYIVDKEEVMDHIVQGGTYDYPPNGDLAREWLLTHDAGSGPYKVTDVLLEDHVYMDRFADYWAEMKTDSPDEIRMLALAVPTTERTMLLKKELEISSQWLPEEVLDALSNAGLASGSYPGGDMFYFMMHCRKPPLDDVHVRRALAYAMDYEAVVDEIYLDNPLAQCVVPVSLGGATELTMYRRDLTAAMEELQQSKYWPDIGDHPENYEIEVDWCAEVPAEEGVALLFAESAQEIGLKVKVVKTPWGKMIVDMADQDLSPHVETVFVAAHYAEAGALLETRYHSKAAATWEQNEWLLNETLDAMIEDALSTTNMTERYQKYAELEQIILDMCPSLFLFDHLVKHSYQPYVIWPSVLGESIPVMGYNIDGRMIEVIPPE